MSSDAATENTLRWPRRPKRKLNTPVNLALTAILIAVVAFWLGGKSKGDDSGASAMPSGFPGMTAAESGSGSSAGSGGMPGMSASSGDSTQGEVTSLSGYTLYVETSDGATVKVKVGADATVTRTAETKADQIHPGDTVTVSGKTSQAGVVKATDVTATQSAAQSAMPSIPGGMPSSQ
jgi:hypothetical protein